MEIPQAGADQRVTLAQAAAESALGGDAHDAEHVEPAEQVAAEEPLWEGGLPGADRDGHRPRAGEFFGDLHAGVPGADDEHRPVGELVRVAVVGGVELGDLSVEVRGQVRDGGCWNGPVATTTVRAVMVPWSVRASNPPPTWCRCRTPVPSHSGSAKWRA